MVAGCDIGTDHLRAARGDGEASLASVSTAVVDLDAGALPVGDVDPDDDRRVTVGDRTYVFGEAAERVAEAGGGERWQLFEHGTLRDRDGTAAVLESALAVVLGEADPPDEPLCYTTPGRLRDAETPTDRHRAVLESALEDRDYAVTAVSEGLAVVYAAEGEDDTGLGVRIGTETTSVCLAYYGVPVLSVGIARGTDDVDRAAAAETDRDPTAVAEVRTDDLALDPTATDGLEGAIAGGYNELFDDLVAAIEDAAGEADLRQGISVPVLLGGAGADVAGLAPMLGGRLEMAGMPFSIADATVVEEPTWAPARGARVAAREDVEPHEEVTWAASAAEPAAAGPAGGEGAAAVEFEQPTDGPSPIEFEDGDGGDAGDDAVEELFDRLADRQEELEAIRGDLEDLAETSADRERVATVEGDLEAVSEDLDTLREAAARADRVEALAEDLEALTGEVATLEEDLEALGRDVDDQAETVADVQETTAAAADLEAVAADLEGLSADLESVRADLDALESAVATADRLEELADEIDRLGAEAPTRATVTAIEEDVESLRTVLEDHRGTVSSLESRVASEADIEEIEGTLASVQEDLGALEDELATLPDRPADALETVETAVDDLEERLAALSAETPDEDDVDAVAAGVHDLEERLEALEDGTVAELAADLEALEGDGIASLQETIAEVTDDVEALESRLEGEDGPASTADLEDVWDSLETIDGRLSDLEGETAGIAGLDERVENLEERLPEEPAAADRLEQLQRRLGKLNERVATQEDLAALRSDLDGESGEAADLAATVASLSDRVESLRTDVMGIKADSAGSEALGDLREEVETLRTHVEPTGGEDRGGFVSQVLSGLAGGAVASGAVLVVLEELVVVGGGLVGLGVVLLVGAFLTY